MTYRGCFSGNWSSKRFMVNIAQPARCGLLAGGVVGRVGGQADVVDKVVLRHGEAVEECEYYQAHKGQPSLFMPNGKQGQGVARSPPCLADAAICFHG